MDITARELIDAGHWDKVCEIEGINRWAVNEGRINAEDEIHLSDKCIRLLLGVTTASPTPPDNGESPKA